MAVTDDVYQETEPDHLSMGRFMSALGWKADINGTLRKSPLIAKSGHSEPHQTEPLSGTKQT